MIPENHFHKVSLSKSVFQPQNHLLLPFPCNIDIFPPISADIYNISGLLSAIIDHQHWCIWFLPYGVSKSLYCPLCALEALYWKNTICKSHDKTIENADYYWCCYFKTKEPIKSRYSKMESLRTFYFIHCPIRWFVSQSQKIINSSQCLIEIFQSLLEIKRRFLDYFLFIPSKNRIPVIYSSHFLIFFSQEPSFFLQKNTKELALSVRIDTYIADPHQ